MTASLRPVHGTMTRLAPPDARQEGARQEGARQEGARQEGARQEGARQDAERQSAPATGRRAPLATAISASQRRWSARLARAAARRLAALGAARAGAMAVIVAFLTIPLMMTLTAGVNFARAEIGKERLQTAIDSAALTLSRELDDADDPRAVVQAYLEANLSGGVINPDAVVFEVVVEDLLNGKSAKIRAEASVDLLFSSFYGFDDISFALSSAAEFSKQDLEISLVLDVSGSMNGARIANLKAAAKDFLDIVLADPTTASNTFVTVIPYSGGVRVGPHFAGYLDPAVDPLTFSGCFDSDETIMDDDLLPVGAFGELDPTYRRWSGAGESWCPPAASAAQFHRNDLEPLKTFIDGMTLGDGTGTDGGVAWGLKALSPDWVGLLPGGQADRPAPYESETVKALIVMTDGRILPQWRPNGSGGHEIKYDQGVAENNFATVCDLARAKPNVSVYAVGFEVPDPAMLLLLQDCASDPSKYYEASGAEIATVFSLIARELTELRLTK